METLKFITQTTNYKDNELSLIAERITHPCSSVKRDLKRGIRMNTVIEEIDLFAGVKERPCGGGGGRGGEDLLHSTKDDLQLVTFSGHGLGIISKSDFDH